ncbi:hypothetical protein MishRS11D_25980 [Methylomagnum ishizawai]|nr:hypothetical protein MishRS11D_25980 [Methylomagnum ishizawai]
MIGDECPPQEIPEGSRFKGYEPYVVQELEIGARNTRFLVECWRTPEGGLIRGELPDWVDGHYGPRLRATALYLHHHGRMTQPLLREMLVEFGIDLSAGQVDALLMRGQEAFHEEKAGLLPAGLSASTAVTVDDTGARHQGRNGYATHIGNDFFAWFGSTERKSRINFLRLLRAGREDAWLTGDALAYMEREGLPEAARRALAEHPVRHFGNQTEWQAHLHALGLRSGRHVRIATEGFLVGNLLQDAPGVRIVVASNFPNERGKKRTIAHDYDVFRRVQRASASEGVCAWPPVDKRGGRGTEHEPLDLEGLDEKEITRGGTRRGEAGEASRGLAPGGTVGGVAGEPWLGRGSPERLVPGARPVRPPAGRLEAGLLPGSRGHGRGIDERPGTAGPQGAQPEPRTGIGA